jgi:hypothetical protein
MPTAVSTPALAFYLMPPRWIRSAPTGFPGPLHAIRLSELRDLIVETDLPGGLRARAFRDGMLAYDFTAWGGHDPNDPRTAFDMHTRRVQLINAHLACLQASMKVRTPMAIASTENVAGVSYDGEGPHKAGDLLILGGGADAGAVLELHLARPNGPHPSGLDYRFSRLLPIIEEDEIRRSYTLLAELLESDQADVALLRAELLVRSQSALAVADAGGALIYAWTAIEGLLGDLLSRYLDDVQDRDAGLDATGNKLRFINGKRREDLEGANVTAWHMTEMLSLADRLPFELYRTINTCRQARNGWLHHERQVSEEDAAAAIRAAQQLFTLVEGVDLRAQRSRECGPVGGCFDVASGTSEIRQPPLVSVSHHNTPSMRTLAVSPVTTTSLALVAA